MDSLGSLLRPSRGREPCPICESLDCQPAPDSPIHHRYPFVPPEARMPDPDTQQEECDEDEPKRGRRKGKRAKHSPDEDRARHGPDEDR